MAPGCKTGGKIRVPASKTCVVCGAVFHKGKDSWEGWVTRQCCSRQCTGTFCCNYEGSLPDDHTLRHHYEIDRLGIDQLSVKYDVAITRVHQRLKEVHPGYLDQFSSTKSRGLDYPPKEDLLRLFNVEFVPLKQVAILYKMSISALNRRMDKYGIPRPEQAATKRKAPIPIIDEETLRRLYDSGTTMNEIASILEISFDRVSKLFRAYDIKIKGLGWGGIDYVCRNGQIVRSSYEVRIGNWLLDNNLEFEYGPKIPGHNMWRSDFLVNGIYIEIWGMTGVPSYYARKKEKIAWYEGRNIPLIQLTSKTACKGGSYPNRLACLLAMPKPAPKPRQIQLGLF